MSLLWQTEVSSRRAVLLRFHLCLPIDDVESMPSRSSRRAGARRRVVVRCLKFLSPLAGVAMLGV